MIEITVDATAVVEEWERTVVEVNSYSEDQDRYLNNYFGRSYKTLISDGGRFTLTFVFTSTSEAVLFRLKHKDIEIVRDVPR